MSEFTLPNLTKRHIVLVHVAGRVCGKEHGGPKASPIPQNGGIRQQ